MNALREYLIRLLAAALICGIVQGFPRDRTAKALTRLVSGVILTLLVLSPLRDLRLPAELPGSDALAQQASEAASEGLQMNTDALGQRIKEEVRSYILDEAGQLGLTVDADIEVSRETLPLPVSAVIRGTVPDSLRPSLEELLQKKLGIPKENITWIS